MKVIGIGLPKTGTTSLQHALSARGMHVIHGPYPVANRGGTFDMQMRELSRFDAMVEWIGLWPLRPVVEKFSDAILVNTVRDYDSWIDSCERHFLPATVPRVIQGRQRRFGINGFDRGIFDELYHRHQFDVAQLQKHGYRVRNLYITQGDGAEALDGILNTGGSMPHKRKGRKRVN